MYGFEKKYIVSLCISISYRAIETLKLLLSPKHPPPQKKKIKKLKIEHQEIDYVKYIRHEVILT